MVTAVVKGLNVELAGVTGVVVVVGRGVGESVDDEVLELGVLEVEVGEGVVGRDVLVEVVEVGIGVEVEVEDEVDVEVEDEVDVDERVVGIGVLFEVVKGVVG